MAFTRTPLSLATTSTGAVTGRTVQFRGRPRTRISAAVTLVGSTKASYRMQGSVDGTNFTNLGSAATTFSSTSTFTQITSTSTVAYAFARVNQISMVTKVTKSAKASIVGY